MSAMSSSTASTMTAMTSELKVDMSALMEMFAMMNAERAAEFLLSCNGQIDGSTLKPTLGSDLP